MKKEARFCETMAKDAEKSREPNSKPASENKPELRKTDEDPVGKVYDSRLIKRLGHYLRPYWLQAAISSVSISLKSMSDVAGPYLVMVGIDRYFPTDKGVTGATILSHEGGPTALLLRHLPTNPMQGITRLALIFLVAQVSAYLFEFIQTYLMQWTGQKIMFDLRRDIFSHMQRMHVGFFDTHAVGRLVTRITSDVDAINEMFTGGILAIVDDFFTLTIMAIVMLNINWWLALLAFAVLPLILIVTRLFRNSVRESYRRVRAAIARINSFTQEHISGMAVVQLFNREERAYKDFEDVNRLHMIAFKDTIFAYALYYPAVEILSSIAIALVIWRGGFGVLAGTVTIGMLAAFNMYSQRFWRPIQDLSDKYNILQAAMAACERIFKLLDTAPEIVSPTNPRSGDGSNRIEFRHVWFTYQKLTPEQRELVNRVAESPERAKELAAFTDIEWILKDVSFTIEPGQTIAIVGHTGAGKTTLTSLMMRFYDVTAGSIRLDGVDLRELISPRCAATSRWSCRTRSSSPAPSPRTFASVTKPSPKQPCARLPATSTCSTSSIRFPRGFDEPVRERGNSLSTGQKQLVNFARALAYNPHILILDEATSSVDTDTELRIRGALERMVEGRTSV